MSVGAIATAATTREAEPVAAGRVGPNAVIQLAAALRHRLDDRAARAVFARAGRRQWLLAAPREMVDERFARELFETVVALFPETVASGVLSEAGRRTADYVLANRIPRPVRAVLPALPPPLSSRLLMAAIGRNAWTFAGSGAFRAQAGAPRAIEIEANPLAVPGCPWHVAVFERLFRALVTPHARVRHTRCSCAGAPACRFAIDFALR